MSFLLVVEYFLSRWDRDTAVTSPCMCSFYQNLRSTIFSSNPKLRCPLLSVAWLSSAQPCPTARGSRLLSGVNSPDRKEVVRARSWQSSAVSSPLPGPPTRDKTLDLRCYRIADSILVLLPPVFYYPALPHVIADYIGYNFISIKHYLTNGVPFIIFLIIEIVTVRKAGKIGSQADLEVQLFLRGGSNALPVLHRIVL